MYRIDPNVCTTYLETECFNLHQTSCHNDICAIDWPCSRHMHPFALTLYLLQKLFKEAEMYVMLNPSYELVKNHDSMRMHNH